MDRLLLQILTQTLSEKDSQLARYRAEHGAAVEDLRAREARIVDLEFDLLAASQHEKGDAGTEKSWWSKVCEEKDAAIARLEGELSKRNCDLQAIVNTELWEKNRCIAKMQSGLEDREREVAKKDMQLGLLTSKINGK